MLAGSEVKSLRAGQVSLEEAYARMDRGEVWLVGCDIQEYKNANAWNHEPKRRRKLLLHRREIEKLHVQVTEKGLTIVPLRLYFKGSRVKAEIGVVRGKKQYDKRETEKNRELDREAASAMKIRG